MVLGLIVLALSLYWPCLPILALVLTLYMGPHPPTLGTPPQHAAASRDVRVSYSGSVRLGREAQKGAIHATTFEAAARL